MKLLLENWREYIKEEQEGEGMLLYHATCSPPESFASGIDAKRAKGYGQGEGFYFYTKKEKAINHAKEALAGKFDKEEACPEDATTAYLVISDEPVTPENFDIDYEVFGSAFAKFILQNIEYFSQNDQALGLGRRAGQGIGHRSGSYLIKPNKKLLGIDSAGVIYLDRPPSEYDKGTGKVLSAVARKLNELNPEMFKQFEEKFLSKASAVKYNGEKTIYPLRIEDLEGNVVWSR
jgi:hypothetical protein